MCETLKGKPKLQWRQQSIRDAGAMGRSTEEPAHRKWIPSKREAICALRDRMSGAELPKSVRAQMIQS